MLHSEANVEFAGSVLRGLPDKSVRRERYSRKTGLTLVAANLRADSNRVIPHPAETANECRSSKNAKSIRKKPLVESVIAPFATRWGAP